MSAASEEIFAEWFKRQHRRVVRTESSYWVENGPRVWQAFPYHWLIQPPEQELNGVLQYYMGIGLRYSAPVEHPLGCISYYVVLEESHYSLNSLEARSSCRGASPGKGR